MTLADIELTVVSLGAVMRAAPSAADVLASVAEAYRIPNIEACCEFAVRLSIVGVVRAHRLADQAPRIGRGDLGPNA